MLILKFGEIWNLALAHLAESGRNSVWRKTQLFYVHWEGGGGGEHTDVVICEG